MTPPKQTTVVPTVPKQYSCTYADKAANEN